MFRTIRYFVIISCFFMLAGSASAGERQFRHIGMSDGLTGEEVTCMLRDRDGFMWLGTDDGLSCFDGSIASRVLSGVSVRCLFQDHTGNLWVGTKGSGVFRVGLQDNHNRQYRTVQSDESSLSYNDVAGIVEDSHGFLWMAVDRGSLDRLDPTSGTFSRHQLVDSDGRALNNALTGIVIDSDETMYLSSWGGGLYCFNPAEDCFKVMSEGREEDLCRHLFSVGIDNDGTLWTPSAHGGLQYLKYGSAMWRRIEMTAKKVVTDNDGGIWVQTSNGVEHLSGGRRESIDILASSIYYDEEDILWLGQLSGGVSYTCPNFNVFEKKEEVGGRIISLMYARDGVLWVGGTNTVRLFDRNWRLLKEFVPPCLLKTDKDRFIQCCVQVSDGSVWLGSYSDILLQYSSDGELLSEHRIREVLGKDTNGLFNIRGIFETTGKKLILCSETGAVLYDPIRREGKVLFHSSGLIYAEDKARCAVTGNSGSLWIGTESGLRCFAETGTQTFLMDAFVYALMYDRSGNLWVGTKSGLYLKAEGEEDFEPVFNMSVRALFEDGTGGIWACGRSSVVHLERDPSNGRYLKFVRPDDFGNSAGACFCKSPDGSIVSGGEDGLIVMNPSCVDRLYRSNETFITGINVLNKEYVPDNCSLRNCREMEFNYFQSSISLKFTSPDIIGCYRVRYRYMLSGVDESWVECRNGITTATYTLLKPGDYEFSVEATDSNGAWSGLVKKVAITIRPPFWNTVWAYLCYLIFILSVAFVVSKYFILKVKVARLLEERHRMHAVSMSVDDNMESPFIRELKKIILDNIGEGNLSVVSIARMMNMSEDQLYRKVKSVTGSSPYAMVVGLRMQKAVDYMETTNMNISEIAFSLGYSELSLFSRAFKKYYNISPKDFQASLQKIDK